MKLDMKTLKEAVKYLEKEVNDCKKLSKLRQLTPYGKKIFEINKILLSIATYTLSHGLALTDEEILEILAQSYCKKENENKVLDSTLLNTIAKSLVARQKGEV